MVLLSYLSGPARLASTRTGPTSTSNETDKLGTLTGVEPQGREFFSSLIRKQGGESKQTMALV